MRNNGVLQWILISSQFRDKPRKHSRVPLQEGRRTGKQHTLRHSSNSDSGCDRSGGRRRRAVAKLPFARAQTLQRRKRRGEYNTAASHVRITVFRHRRSAPVNKAKSAVERKGMARVKLWELNKQRIYRFSASFGYINIKTFGFNKTWLYINSDQRKENWFQTCGILQLLLIRL